MSDANLNQNETEHGTASSTGSSTSQEKNTPTGDVSAPAFSASCPDAEKKDAAPEKQEAEDDKEKAAPPAATSQEESSDGIEITQLEEHRAGETPETPEKKKKTKKKKKKHHPVRWVILLVLVLVAVYLYRNWPGTGTEEVSYLPATATTQDLTTSDSFTGAIAAVDSQSVVSAISGAKVIEVDVEEGDMVEAGDVIAKLDTTSVEQQIRELQVSMSSSATKSSLSIESAQQQYDNLTENLEDGLDSSTNSALQQIDSAFQSLTSALESYNNEVLLNNDAASTTISNAIQSVQSAYEQLQSATLQTQQAYQTKTDAIYQYEKTLREGDEYDFDGTSYDQQIASAELSQSNAQTSYDTALANYETAKITEENSLTKLYDAVTQAETSYINAITNYNTIQRQIEQQLESYKLAIETAKANADQSSSELQLQELQDSLDDYVIKAPMSGEITSLDCQVGDITQVSSTTSLATITNYDKMKVSISVSEYDISNLSIGSSVTVTVDALSRDFEGTVTAIDKIGTNSSSIAYFTCEVEFTPDGDVLEGMTAEVNLTVTEAADAIVLPSNAVMTDTDGSSYVYTKNDDGTYTKKTVTLGETDGSVTQITDGVSDGETVYYTIATADTTDSPSSSGLFGSLFSNLTGGSSSSDRSGRDGGGMPGGDIQGGGMQGGMQGGGAPGQ